MRWISTWAAGRFAPGYQDPGNVAARTRVGLLEGWVSVVLNTAMAAVKGVLGYMAGSVSLVADAVHTFADSGTSIVVIYGFRAARKPADKEHPYGHGRIESIAGIVIGVLLAVTAVEMGREAIGRILEPQTVEASTWAIPVLALMLVLKALLARFSSILGNLIDSDALKADAWHHATDVYATGLVIAAFVAPRFGLDWFDGVAGAGVAAMIGWAAVEILRQASRPVIGTSAPEPLYAKVAAIARSTDGVRSVHDIRIEQYGTVNVVSLHVTVGRSISIEAAHQITASVEARLADALRGSVTVHADPETAPHPRHDAVWRALDEFLGDVHDLSSFHDVRVLDTGDGTQVSADAVAVSDVSDARASEIRRRLAERLGREVPGVRVDLAFDPPYMKADPLEVTRGSSREATGRSSTLSAN